MRLATPRAAFRAAGQRTLVVKEGVVLERVGEV